MRHLIEELEVTVEEIRYAWRWVPIESYGGERPVGIVTISGRGHEGRGELVAFYEEHHEAAEAHLPGVLLGREGPLANLLPRESARLTPYEEAAVEGALIDLAMRQNGVSLRDLTGCPAEVALRTVISLDEVTDPRALLARHPDARLKVDVGTRDLAGLPVDVADFKGRGDAALVARIEATLPGAILEDPPWPSRDMSKDRSLRTAQDVHGAHWYNLKAPRMGGFLEALAASERAPGRCYWGGMFEVDVGRRQARALAALVCPDAPNDLALIPRREADRREERVVRLDTVGFG